MTLEKISKSGVLHGLSFFDGTDSKWGSIYDTD